MRAPRLLRSLAALLFGLACAAPAPAAAPTSALAEALQRKYASVRDFSASFVHTYRGGVLNKTLREEGRVLIRKPGMMRWEYRAPDTKLFVSDGVSVYAYVPADRQVMVSAVPPTSEASTPALFLAGKGDLMKDFVASDAPVPAGSVAGARALKLVPRVPQAEYDWLLLIVDGTSLALRGLVTTDAQGGVSSFTFSDLKENVGLTPGQFTFTVPRGVEVIKDGHAR